MFLCVGFSWNWLNADKGQNCEKVDRSIPSIFRLPVVFCKYCYLGNSKQVPPQLKLKNLLLLLLLCGDVAVNPGPTNFGFVHCRSIRNKGPLLHDLIQCNNLDILGLVETHITPTDTDGLLNCLTPLNYNLIQNLSVLDWVVVLAFCVENLSLPVLSLHLFLDHLKSLHYLSGPTTIALLLLVCIVLLVLLLLNFWKIFWLFLSSIGSNFIICGDMNVHPDVECGDRSRFNDILQCSILGHTLDVLISPCDSISDHAAIKCQLDFSHPTTCTEKNGLLL